MHAWHGNAGDISTAGPGEYHSSTPDISGPAWTIAGKLADPASERAADGPGPGEHHKGDWSSLAGPAFTLAGKAAVLDREADSPGPGECGGQHFLTALS